MSRSGSGIKTVMIVLANLIIRPQMEKKKLSEYLFAFEELENNLHPAAQRRLFRYLRNKAEEEGCHLFLTTHSNVVIDQFANDDIAQILHVTHDGTAAKVEPFSSSHHGWAILDDLDIRASDLLQTNAVIWVEGPSDRIYVNRWIKLWTSGRLQEGIHYQCLPYGGDDSKHFGFDEPEFINDVVSAMRINKNAVFITDSDRELEMDMLKPTKERLLEEIGKVGGIGFVTAGREIENYIPQEAWREFESNPAATGPGQYDSAIEYVRASSGKGVKKIRLAYEMSKILTKEMLETSLDLGQRLDEVCGKLLEWNRL